MTTKKPPPTMTVRCAPNGRFVATAWGFTVEARTEARAREILERLIETDGRATSKPINALREH